MSDNCGVEFLIYTQPHPGRCLVLVMAAVFTRCNWTKMASDHPKLVIFDVATLVLSAFDRLLTFPI